MLMFRPLIRYAVFSGRASRAEYWLFMLLHNLVVGGSLGMAFAALGNADPGAAVRGFMTWFGVTGLLALGLFLPMYAVLVRRLHDIDKSGWWILLLAPGIVSPILIGQVLVGAAMSGGSEAAAGAAIVQALAHSAVIMGVGGICNLILFIMTLLPGTKGPNRFGQDPRDPHASGEGSRRSIYDEDHMESVIAAAKREREGDYKPVFDFGPGPEAATVRIEQAAPVETPRPVDWHRPAWDPGIAPSRPFGRRGS